MVDWEDGGEVTPAASQLSLCSRTWRNLLFPPQFLLTRFSPCLGSRKEGDLLLSENEQLLRSGGIVQRGEGSSSCRKGRLSRGSGQAALIKANISDRWGSLVYHKTARNFNPVMATAADVTIAHVYRFRN